MNIRISHSGSKGACKGDYQKPCFVRSSCLCGFLGPYTKTRPTLPTSLKPQDAKEPTPEVCACATQPAIPVAIQAIMPSAVLRASLIQTHLRLAQTVQMPFLRCTPNPICRPDFLLMRAGSAGTRCGLLLTALCQGTKQTTALSLLFLCRKLR